MSQTCVINTIHTLYFLQRSSVLGRSTNITKIQMRYLHVYRSWAANSCQQKDKPSRHAEEAAKYEFLRAGQLLADISFGKLLRNAALRRLHTHKRNSTRARPRSIFSWMRPSLAAPAPSLPISRRDYHYFNASVRPYEDIWTDLLSLSPAVLVSRVLSRCKQMRMRWNIRTSAVCAYRLQFADCGGFALSYSLLVDTLAYFSIQSISLLSFFFVSKFIEWYNITWNFC